MEESADMTSGGHGLSSVLLKSWHLTSGRLVAVSSLRLASASLQGPKSEAQRLSIHYSRRNRRIDLYCNTCHCLLYRIISELVSLGHESTLPLRIKTPVLTFRGLGPCWESNASRWHPKRRATQILRKKDKAQAAQLLSFGLSQVFAKLALKMNSDQWSE